MRYRFYTTSAKAWLAMLEAIKSAKTSIYLESYILIDDEVTHYFFEELERKAKQGIKVKIIVDKVGNFWTASLDKVKFEKAGAEVLFFNRWFYRTHRKILIVDESIAFLGGVNVSGAYAKWLDLHLRVTGQLVKRLLQSFGRMYQLCGGKEHGLLLSKKWPLAKTRSKIYKAKSWLIERWPIKGRSAFRAYYKRKCSEAKKSIVIVTPYFIPHRWLVRSLQRAIQRGVRVEVILPSNTDVWLARIANLAFAESLQDGIKFFFLPEMIHAKVLLVDDQEGLIGSNNIDAQSFDFNLEASVVFQRKDMVGDLKKITENWKKIAIPFAEVQRQRHWYERIFGFFIRFFQPIL